MLDLDSFEFIDFPARNSAIARTRVGDTWLVLVCPADDESPPGRHLAEHGEGLFLISFGVDHLPSELDRLIEDGFVPTDPKPRDGIVNWRVADVDHLHGAILQLAQEAD